MSSEIEVLDSEILAIKEQLLALGNAKEEMIHSRRLESFVPSPKQFQFFQNADKRHRAGFCGNRFGKSTVGVVEDCSWALGERPFFDTDNPLRRLGIPTHGVKGLVIAEDWDKVHEIFTNRDSLDRPGKFFEYLPQKNIKSVTRNQKGIINSITVINEIDGKTRESIIVFDTVRSFLNNPRSFESSDWDFIHGDEPFMKELWIAASRGLLDRGGKYWWLMTPLGFPWMYDESIAAMRDDPENVFCFEASMDDNPLLDKTAKEAYILSLPDEERKARQEGKPLAHGRRVYGHFDEKIHVWKGKNPPANWKDFRTPSPSCYCSYALDPHPQTPHAVLFAAVARNNDIYLYDEIFEKCLISEVAKKIVVKRDKVRCSVELCDPCAWNEDPETGLSWSHTLHANHLNVIRASKEKTNGIMQTQEMWKNRRVYVMPHMTRFLKEIKSYFFDRENKPVDKDDHLMECLYRLYVHDAFRYYAPKPKVLPPIKIKDEFQQVKYDMEYTSNYKL